MDQRQTSTRARLVAVILLRNAARWSKGTGRRATVATRNFKRPLFALDDALKAFILPSDGSPVVVADLGSSSGPNRIDVVADIAGKLRQRLPENTAVQAYFNDLPSNDFNNLFQLLSKDSRAKNFYAAGVPGSFYFNNLFQLLSKDSRAKNFYAAGVLGSFYDRLFPESSVHIFNSANSLHWLSTIPDAILQNKSPAYNKGKTWMIHSHSAVAKAYQKQALVDLNFLLARTAELVSGGLLFFFCNGRSTSEPNEPLQDAVERFTLQLDDILSGLVAEGLVTQQQLDTFNFPIYNRSMEDLTEALGHCGSMFDAVTAKLEKVDLNALWSTLWRRYEISLDKKPDVSLPTVPICVVALIRTSRINLHVLSSRGSGAMNSFQALLMTTFDPRMILLKL